MHYHQNLQRRLEARRESLRKGTRTTYPTELKYLLDLIQRTPYLRALVQELDAQHPETTWSDWRWYFFPRSGKPRFALPDTEAAAAKVCYGLIQECIEHQDIGDFTWVATSSPKGAFTVDFSGRMPTRYTPPPEPKLDLGRFTNLLIDPFLNYLLERIEQGNNILSLLQKYKLRTEWFRRDELLARLQADSKQSEAVANKDLREYLFDQGIDWPFLEPASPSGEADVVAALGETDPLVLEIKLFDLDRGYDRGYVRKGFRQIYEYAVDYGQAIGYLVVYNCTGRQLVFRTQTLPQLGVPRIEFDHRTFFIIVVNLAAQGESASKRGRLQPYVIEESYLVEVATPSDEVRDRQEQPPTEDKDGSASAQGPTFAQPSVIPGGRARPGVMLGTKGQAGVVRGTTIPSSDERPNDEEELQVQ